MVKRAMRVSRFLAPVLAVTLTGMSPNVISSSPGVVVAANAIETPANGVARLGLPDGSLLELMQRTRVTFDADTVRLEHGTVRLDAPTRGSGTMQLATPQARVVFHAMNGYVTAGPSEDVVTCVRCRRLQPAQCEKNDFIVRDFSRCVSLENAGVAFVSREHGIRAQTTTEEEMVSTILRQVGVEVRSFFAAQQQGLRMSRDALSTETGKNGQFRVVERLPGGGDVWALSTNSEIVAVTEVDPAGSCRWRAAGEGYASVVLYDQLGRYAVIPVEVSSVAAR